MTDRKENINSWFFFCFFSLLLLKVTFYSGHASNCFGFFNLEKTVFAVF